jgi:transcriptional regulator CtsR
MPTLADYIAEYIKKRLAESPDGCLEVQRSDLADRFQCTPSQVTYVLSTRFDVRAGFLVESRRGGGGFIRIVKLSLPEQSGLVGELYRHIGSRIGPREAREIVLRLHGEGLISEREARLMIGAVDNRTLRVVDVPWRNAVRAGILKGMLGALLGNGDPRGAGSRGGKDSAG